MIDETTHVKGLKECTKCEEVKHLEEFSRAPRNRSGYASWCRDCAREQVNARPAPATVSADDTDIKLYNRRTRQYQTQRGRKWPVCGTKVRYTKTVAYCDRHDPDTAEDVPPSQERYLPKQRHGGPETVALPRLRALRKKPFPSAAEFAEASGVHEKTILNLETGNTEALLATAEKLAKALGVRVEDLK